MQIFYSVTQICMNLLLKILFFPIQLVFNWIIGGIQNGIMKLVSAITIFIIIGIVISQKL